ncbi:ABC transporter ATP-binding protein [Candidatus Sumerlaeota bacterium]|nr:ABC transporter ATP-binding protein [Candidatus Sumerlaeota bacterium]
MTTAPHLACHGVDFAHGPTPVLQGVEVEIPRGEWVGLIGPNGAGKSTLLNLLVGWWRPQRGEIRIAGDPVHRLAPGALARRLAMVPQAAPLVFGHRVADVVAMGRHPHQGALQWTLGPEDRERVALALERADITALAPRRFNELSGGERQLVLIARALAQSTEILLLDEPTASLDLHHQAQIIEVLARLHREEGTTILWVAHDLNLVGRVCQRLVLLAKGCVVADSSPEEILTAERLSQVYETPVTIEVTRDGSRRVEIALPETSHA